MSKRNWRYDRVEKVVSEFDSGPPHDGEPAGLRAPSRAGRPGRLRRLAARLARAKAWTTAASSLSAGEQVLHEFGAVLASTEDHTAIERAFIDLAQRLVGERQVEWVREPGPEDVDDPGAGRLLAGRGARPCGQLVVRPREGDDGRLPAPTVRRLRALCDLMAAACLRGGPPAASRKPAADNEAGSRAACLIPGVQDATFLHAVLPYAIGQSRRHGEPLSVLCVSLDRLGGIIDLLGRERAEFVLRNIATFIASQIRSSDFVSRLDDDRLLVVLPRAALHDSVVVAQKICSGVEKHPQLLPELGRVTVSIGVAEFPACANTVFELVDAADHALGLAKSNGRNQVAAAPIPSNPDPVRLSRCAS